jgi:hypothetical protein
LLWSFRSKNVVAAHSLLGQRIITRAFAYFTARA